MVIPILVVLSCGVALLLVLTLWLVKLVKSELIPQQNGKWSDVGTSSTELLANKKAANNVNGKQHGVKTDMELRRLLNRHRGWREEDLALFYSEVLKGFDSMKAFSDSVNRIKKGLDIESTKSAQTVVVLSKEDLPAEGWQKQPNTRLLGSGSYARVYLTHNASSVPIAVKVLSISSTMESEKLLREITNLTLSGNCPQVVRYYGSRVGPTDNELHLFMEYLPGGSLSNFLKSRKPGDVLHMSTIISYVTQVLLGVETLHRNGMVHRDLKGENILLSADKKKLKISDFGTSKQLWGSAGGTHAKTITGTPLWMAPEVIRGGEDVEGNNSGGGYGYPADIWSVGCVVIEMFNDGNPPWELGMLSASSWSVMKKIGYWTKPMPEVVPACITPIGREFLGHMFCAEPRLRYTATQLLSHRFLTLPVTTTIDEHSLNAIRQDIEAAVSRSTSRGVSYPLPSAAASSAGSSLQPLNIPGFTAVESIADEVPPGPPPEENL